MLTGTSTGALAFIAGVNRYWDTAASAGLVELECRLAVFLIEGFGDRMEDADVFRSAVYIDREIDGGGALNLRQVLLRKLGVYAEDNPWSGYAAAYVVFAGGVWVVGQWLSGMGSSGISGRSACAADICG
jgi:hypothetical protein